jgi:hypothetical protein
VPKRRKAHTIDTNNDRGVMPQEIFDQWEIGLTGRSDTIGQETIDRLQRLVWCVAVCNYLFMGSRWSKPHAAGGLFLG